MPNAGPKTAAAALADSAHTQPSWFSHLADRRIRPHKASGLQTIAKLGADGSSKADVLKAPFALKDTSSVLGIFGVDMDGDTALKSYGL